MNTTPTEQGYPMIKTTLAIDPLRDRRCLADHEVNIKRPDRAIPMALTKAIAGASMFAACYPILFFIMAERIFRSNAEAIAGRTGAGDKLKEKRGKPGKSVEPPSVADFLASDRRSIACETLDSTPASNFMTSLRKDLILAASVVY